MQNTSTTYKNLLTNDIHTFDVRLNIGGTIYGTDAIYSASASSRLFDSAPTIGGTYSNTFEFSVILPSGASVARMASVVPQFRATANGTSSAWYTYGTYYIDTRETSQNDSGISVLKAFCYDAMLKANADYGTSSLSWPATDITVVGEIATKMGVTVDSRTTSIMNKGYTIPTVPISYTLRDILSYIAVMYGGNWIITPANKLRLIPIAGGTDTLNVGKSVSNLNVSPTRNAYTKLQVSVSEDTDTVIESGSSDDVVMTAVCPFITQAIADTVFASISSFQYKPFTASGVWSDPAVELGDIVTINGFTAPVCAIDTAFGPGMVMDMSAPNDNYIDHEYAYESPSSRSYKKTLGQMSTSIEQNAEAILITSEKLANFGGRNYAWAVDEKYHTTTARNCTYTYNPQNGGEYVVVNGPSTGTYSQLFTYHYRVPDELIGQQVIFHADYIGATGASNPSPFVRLFFYDENDATISMVDLVMNRLSVTNTVPATARYMNIVLYVRSNPPFVPGETLTVRGLKLEKGTVATDWTPAPEDDASLIASNKAAIDVNADNIALKVSQTDYNGNTIASLINQTATTTQIQASKINLTGYVTASSLTATGTTTIDGSRITTGYISADRIAANSITASKINLTDLFSQNITATNMNITGGSVNINTATDTSGSCITIYNNSHGSVTMSSSGVSLKDTSTNTTLAWLGFVYGLSSPTYAYLQERHTSGGVANYGPQFWNISGASGTYTRTYAESTYIQATNTSTGAEGKLTIGGLSLTNGTQSISLSAGGASQWLNGANKYSALIWPDSNGAGRLVLGDGTSTKWRTELTNNGLVFRNASDVVTAQYPATGWATFSSYLACTIGTDWTLTTTSYTVPSTGWYIIEADLLWYYSAPRGVMIAVEGNTTMTPLSITEFPASSVVSKTVGTLITTCAARLTANNKIVVLAKSASSNNNTVQFYVHGPIA